MREIISGTLLLAIWVALQFIVQVQSGLIHLLLAGGVLLIIRGIALANPGANTK